MSKIRADEIRDALGTGAPSFPKGVSSNSGSEYRWRRKVLGGNHTSVGAILTISGLSVGRQYRLSGFVSVYFSNASQSTGSWQLRENGNALGTGEFKEEGAATTDENRHASMSVIFTATGTSCDMYCASISNMGYDNRTMLYIEELPFHGAEDTVTFT